MWAETSEREPSVSGTSRGPAPGGAPLAGSWAGNRVIVAGDGVDLAEAALRGAFGAGWKKVYAEKRRSCSVEIPPPL